MVKKRGIDDSEANGNGDAGNGSSTIRGTLAGPVFGESSHFSAPSLDTKHFKDEHEPDNATYDSVKELQKNAVVEIPPSAKADHELFRLEDAIGPSGSAITTRINTAKRIVFHALGDSGAVSASDFNQELSVASELTDDAHTSDEDDRPAFLLHLGDIVYSFGESAFYFEQFYEPLRDYPAPIFAIPGNHDSFVVPGTPKGEEPLTTFQRNFCSTEPGFVVTKEAGSLHRTAMKQPGVYYALEAPFVRILALFSNALEDPGVISSQGGKWPVSDVQLSFLKAQFKKAKDENYAGALIVALHHPPFSYAPRKTSQHGGGNHSSSSEVLSEIDKIAKAAGIYPHAFLSGHAHNYQRYTRTVEGINGKYDVPFIVCGNGGHHVNKLVMGRRGVPAVDPDPGDDVTYLDVGADVVNATGLTLENYDDEHGHSGYLRITVDSRRLKIDYHSIAEGDDHSGDDVVVVDLTTHQLVKRS